MPAFLLPRNGVLSYESPYMDIRMRKENIPEYSWSGRSPRVQTSSVAVPADKRRREIHACMRTDTGYTLCQIHTYHKPPRLSRDPSINKEKKKKKNTPILSRLFIMDRSYEVARPTLGARIPDGGPRARAYSRVRAFTFILRQPPDKEGQTTAMGEDWHWVLRGRRRGHATPFSYRCESRACGNKQFVTSRVEAGSIRSLTLYPSSTDARTALLRTTPASGRRNNQ